MGQVGILRSRVTGPGLVLLAVLTVSSSAVAEEPLVTDRPDFTESSSTVGIGVVQIEAGTTYSEFSGGSDAFTFGEALIRWGVIEELEIRVVLPTYSTASNSGGSTSGFLDSGVGIKYDLKKATGDGFIGAMEAAVIAATTVPTGNAEYSSSSWQPTLVGSVSWELGRTTGLGVNLGIARPEGDGRRFTSAWLSSALGVGISDAASVFFELIAFDREEERGPNTLTFQTGVVYLLSPDLQLDLRAARRLSGDGVDILLGGGISWRIGG